MALNIDREKTKKTIALVLDNIRTEADADLLDEYHRLFKKEVSLFHRTTAAAYLLMLFDQGKNLRAARGNYAGAEGKPRRAEKYSGDPELLPRRRIQLAEEESRRLFFSAGRSRRVFPREILGLINTKTAIPREDIGAIRILENYSFVQVRDTVAEQIIEALNGIMFRGRPLTVNYAKSRRDGEADNGDAADTSADTDTDADTDDDAADAWNTAADSDEYADSENQDEYAEEDNLPEDAPDSEQRQDQAEKEDI